MIERKTIQEKKEKKRKKNINNKMNVNYIQRNYSNEGTIGHRESKHPTTNKLLLSVSFGCRSSKS